MASITNIQLKVTNFTKVIKMHYTPVLVIIFNRPEATKQLFERLAIIQPQKLYIIADAPRAGVEQDVVLCNETRAIFKQIDWKCDIKTKYNTKNMGCDATVISGINWFFEHEEMGIILEDDCIPSISFFYFCEKMLEIYKTNPDIALICGTNYLDRPLSKKYDYYIGDFMHTWGWATWKHIWDSVDWSKRFSSAAITDKLLSCFHNKSFAEIMHNNIINSYACSPVNWDAVFFINNIFENKKGIIPNINMISNVGFTGTHFNNSSSKLLNTPFQEFEQVITFKGTDLNPKDLKKLVDNYVEKNQYLTIRDKLYIFRKSISKYLTQ